MPRSFPPPREGAPAPTPVTHSGPVLARNALLAFLAQVVPLLVAFFALPVLVRGLGTPRFGAFQLIWVVLGYFAVLDLGLGRAANKFVAEYAARGEAGLMRETAAAALAVQVVASLVGAAVIAILIPAFTRSLLKVPPELAGEVIRSFYLLVLALPAVLLGSTYSGILQAVQRFDLVARVQVVTGVGTYGLPITVIAVGASLTAVVATVVAVRVAACVAYAVLTYRVLPALKGPLRPSRVSLRRVATFGGWVTVSNVTTPIMMYLDRYVLASLLGLAAVAYYSAPYDVIVRLTIVPASVVPPLFSAFSALGGTGDRARVVALFSRGARYLALAMVPLTVSLVVLARPGLHLWLGDAFAEAGTLPAQILGVGMALNALAHLPFATLQALGRADLPAKFHVVELPIYGALLWLLVPRLGIAGAALAWSGRMALDAVLLYRGTFTQLSISAFGFVTQVAIRTAPAIVAFTFTQLAFAAAGESLAVRLAGAAAAGVVGLGVAARLSLDSHERATLVGVLAGARKWIAK